MASCCVAVHVSVATSLRKNELKKNDVPSINRCVVCISVIEYSRSLLTDMDGDEPAFQATQPLEDEVDQLPPKNVWGYLVPHHYSMNRIDFVRPVVTLGREERKLFQSPSGPQTVYLGGRQIS